MKYFDFHGEYGVSFLGSQSPQTVWDVSSNDAVKWRIVSIFNRLIDDVIVFALCKDVPQE